MLNRGHCSTIYPAVKVSTLTININFNVQEGAKRELRGGQGTSHGMECTAIWSSKIVKTVDSDVINQNPNHIRPTGRSSRG